MMREAIVVWIGCLGLLACGSKRDEAGAKGTPPSGATATTGSGAAAGSAAAPAAPGTGAPAGSGSAAPGGTHAKAAPVLAFMPDGPPQDIVLYGVGDAGLVKLESHALPEPDGDVLENAVWGRPGELLLLGRTHVWRITDGVLAKVPVAASVASSEAWTTTSSVRFLHVAEDGNAWISRCLEAVPGKREAQLVCKKEVFFLVGPEVVAVAKPPGDRKGEPGPKHVGKVMGDDVMAQVLVGQGGLWALHQVDDPAKAGDPGLMDSDRHWTVFRGETQLATGLKGLLVFVGQESNEQR